MIRIQWVPTLAVTASLWIVGCSEKPKSPAEYHQTSHQPGSPEVPAVNTGPTIRIASFNIQVFGGSKLKKPEVMNVLARTVRRFDVVAIQEVRSKDETVLPNFVEMINAEGGHYDFVIGPRLGRTSSKEQYAIVFDASRLEVHPQHQYTIQDPDDLLHREPYVARFRVRGVADAPPFTFSLVDIHTDPDETKSELDALADVFVAVQNDGSGEDDIILLGDLNVDEYHLGRLGELPGITHAIAGVPTNTRGDKTYDNIVFDSRMTREFTGRAGVFNLRSEFGLTLEQALEVSDHMPIWAEFGVEESPAGGPLATRPRNPR